MSPLLDFSSQSNPRRYWPIAIGFWILLTAAFFWGTYLVIAYKEGQEFLSEKQREERQAQHDAQVQSQFQDIRNEVAKLGTGVAETKEQVALHGARRLTKEQQSEIVKAMTPFKGTKISVRYPMGSGDGLGIAQDFAFTFREAGLDCTQVEGSPNICNFDTMVVCLSQEDAVVNHFPVFMFSLGCILANLGLAGDPHTHFADSELKRGEFRLWIGPHTGRKMTPPANKWTVIRLPGRAIGMEINDVIQVPTTHPTP